MKILCVAGTRPEVIKMAPVIQALRTASLPFDTSLCVTAQHRDLLAPLLTHFGLNVDDDLDVMRPDQSLQQLTSLLFATLPPIIDRYQPDLVLVQGDTTSAMVASMCAFYAGVPAGHVEAGLRTGRLDQPFPEEMNRVLIDRVSTLYFAPTQSARENLLAEGRDGTRIFVTGNTGVDALHWTLARKPALPPGLDLADAERMVLVTIHRRESFGHTLAGICDALLALSASAPRDVRLVVTLHPNPNVGPILRERLANRSNITLLDPVDYPQAIALLSRSYFVITDSGGLQEEAPALGKPVLVVRDITERPEGIEAGVAELVGRNRDRIVSSALRLLEDEDTYASMARVEHLYGDGHAAGRIVATLAANVPPAPALRGK